MLKNDTLRNGTSRIGSAPSPSPPPDHSAYPNLERATVNCLKSLNEPLRRGVSAFITQDFSITRMLVLPTCTNHLVPYVLSLTPSDNGVFRKINFSGNLYSLQF